VANCNCWLILIQDEYIEALKKLNQTLTHAHKINRDLKFEVFIHKVDGISDDNKIELQRDISQRASVELAEAGLGSELHLRYIDILGCIIYFVNQCFVGIFIVNGDI